MGDLTLDVPAGGGAEEQQLSSGVQQQVDAIRRQLGETLEAITNDLASDISREQEHLMLMQDQVDKTKSLLQKDLTELSKKLEQERMQRSSAQSSMNDTLQMLRNAVAQRDADVEDMEARLLALERRGSLWALCTQCFRSSRPSPGLSVPEHDLAEPLAMRRL
mmetsp:Transcript_19208/g.49309  ORF Transcript_19208/g.49309 Transcript_19208/m.49309 type:complete len:163 (+) Transcript_19208:142-630(+)|eukprot:jgi/Tetstr1/435705/TSEL_024604.t1